MQGKYKRSYKGEVFGDFEITARYTRSSVGAKCRRCGKERRFALGAIKQKPLCECNPEFSKIPETKKYVYRRATATTKKLICIYYAQGDEICEICDTLKRNASQVKRILRACIKSGDYLKYAEGSIFTDMKMAAERMESFK